MPESRPDSCEKEAYLSSYSSAEKIPWAWVDTDGWREGGRKGRKVQSSRSRNSAALRRGRKRASEEREERMSENKGRE